MFKNILVAHDGSEGAQKAFDTALQLAMRLDALSVAKSLSALDSLAHSETSTRDFACDLKEIRTTISGASTLPANHIPLLRIKDLAHFACQDLRSKGFLQEGRPGT